MLVGDEALQTVDVTQRDGQDQHHGKSGVDGSSDEIGWKEGTVPAGYDGHGKVEADYGVDREHQRRGQSG